MKYIIKGINEKTNENVFETLEYHNDLVALIESGMYAMVRNCYKNYSLYRVNLDGSLTKLEI